MDWYLQVLKKYTVFNGRARRKEYWIFFLANIIISSGLNAVEVVLGIAPESDQSILASIYALAVFLPGLAVTVRRLHDTGRSGWWIIIPFIPLIGVIILLAFLLQDSQSGENKYGPNPKLTQRF